MCYVSFTSVIFRENIKRKKEESELESEWDDIGSAFTEVYNIDLDDDIDLDDMVV